MFKMSIATNFAQVSKQLDQLQRGVLKAAAQAVNKTAFEAEAAMAREMQKNLGVPEAKVRKVLHVDRARVEGSRLSLSATLRARTEMALPGRAAQVVDARTIIKGYRGAMAVMSSWRRTQQAKGVTPRGRRAGPGRSMPGAIRASARIAKLTQQLGSRLPIKKQRLLSAAVAEQFQDRRVVRKTIGAIHSRFGSNFESAMQKYIARFNNGPAPRSAATSGKKRGSLLRNFLQG